MCKCSNYSKKGRALLHCHQACSNNNHLHCCGVPFFFIYLCDFLPLSHFVSNNNIIAKRGGGCVGVAIVTRGGGGRGGRRMEQHCHCAYSSNNRHRRFGVDNFFSFVCVRFYHCYVSCSNNNIVIRGGGRRCTSGATKVRGRGKHYHAQQHRHHTCNSRSHFHHFARGIFFICLCEVLPSPYMV